MPPVVRTHAVLIVPGYGFTGYGRLDRGRSIGRYSEMDVVDGYLQTLVEDLDNEGIRFEVLDTRKRPGIAAEERHQKVEGHRLVLHLRAGWVDEPPPNQKNITHLYYGGPGAKDVAEELAEAVSDWGQCFVYGHRTANPAPRNDDLLLRVPDTIGVRIEPFQLNGPDVEEYMRRLPQLGICLSRAITGYLSVRQQARARHVIGLGG